MSHFLSCKIADFLVRQQQIPEQEWEICQYGYDTLIYSMEQTFLLLILGALLHQMTGTLLHIASYFFIRRYTGGYHASTRLGCTIMTLFTYLLSIGFGNALTYFPHFYIVIGFLQIVYYVLIYQYAPVEHPNKPLTMDQIKRNRRNIFILSILFTIVVLLCSLHSINAASTLTCSLMSIAVLTIHSEHRSQSHS
ncbi:MAG TPA: hypothetical protein DHV96_07370 [Lachnospiraceae bacterium]|nr:hypothetical protein [Lachnospiraceae bacterium]